MAPSITYPATAQANAALCTSNAQNCRYFDPFCLGTCAGANNGGVCQSCIKGTVPTPIPDSNNNNWNVYTCQACPLPGCTNCYINVTAGYTVTCTECENNFLLVNDMTTGTLVQSCQRS